MSSPQDHFRHCENIWRKFARIKYPSLAEGSDEYMRLRHSFFVGVWAMMGLAQKLPPGRVGQDMFNDIHHEVRAVLRPDEYTNINGIIVPNT